LEVILIAGVILFIGFFIGKFTNLLRSPMIVGYIIAGLLLGPSLLKILNLSMIEGLGFISDLALGFIAYTIGAELRRETLKRMGLGIGIIILSESFLAFALVFFATFLLTHKLYIALLMGAMAPASAPAGTALVIQEYRAKGPLTSALYAVVGLDDGLAIMIYAFAAALAKLYIGGSHSVSISSAVLMPLLEIFGAISLGLLLGLLLSLILKWFHSTTEVLILSTAIILICTGISKQFGLSLILSNFILGMTAINFSKFGRRSSDAIRNIAQPVYVMFFVLAGAHLKLWLLPSMGLIGVLYILFRTLGLMSGAFIGAVISKASKVIRNYLGLGILSQAGVAVGLAISVTREFSEFGTVGQNLGVLIINIIAATTIFFEILGPITTKIALKKAGEIGKAVY